MDKHEQLARFIKEHGASPVVEFNASCDKLLQLDFTVANTGISAKEVANTPVFCSWVNKQLEHYQCRYGIGGYMEHRTLYARSQLFDTDKQEPRRLHLGIDIWAAAGTPVYAPLSGIVHSFQDNNHFGDYGPTIILQHNLNGLTLYTLYGHLSRASLGNLHIGQTVNQGQAFAAFGTANENGSWPPHLHFQLMFDMQGRWGDYPGVCRYSEKDQYRQNIPDPAIILQYPPSTIISVGC